MCEVAAEEVKRGNEFRSHQGRVTEEVCTQNGSKSLQHYLDTLSGELCEAVVGEIVAEVLPTGCKIICDTFGNYFYQVGFERERKVMGSCCSRKRRFRRRRRCCKRCCFRKRLLGARSTRSA